MEQKTANLGHVAGKSAYEYAVKGGYKGTEAEFQALMGSGPWLPAKEGVVLRDVRIGGAENGCKLVLDGPDGSETIYEDPTAESGNPAEIQATMRALTLGPERTAVLELSGRVLCVNKGIYLCGKRILNVGDPVLDDDAANKGYADKKAGECGDAIKRNGIFTYGFTLSGPLAAGETAEVALKTNPGIIGNVVLYFGEKRLGSSKPAAYSFEAETKWGKALYNADATIRGYETTLEVKALTAIPAGTDVDMMVVWCVSENTGALDNE